LPAEDPRAERLHTKEKELDNRSPFQRDRDRLLYSSAFRRLVGVTQVVSAAEGHVFHNRLTHTMKVAQVGRRLAERVLRDDPTFGNVLDPDVVEAACIAHDLGHPPFGHVGEEKLHSLMSERDPANGFEGNAQSFRIVTRLSLCTPDWPGVNLTRASLNAIIKYPWLHDPDDAKAKRKWGAYTSELDEFRFARSLSSRSTATKRTSRGADQALEAATMDWADDVTYAVHDMEDFHRAGLIPLDRLKTSAAERASFAEWHAGRSGAPSADETNAALSELLDYFGSARPYEGSRSQREAIRGFSSMLVGRYIKGPTVSRDRGHPTLDIPSQHKTEVKVLKALTWYYVIERPALAAQQYGQTRMLEGLFEILEEAADPDHRTNRRLLPIATCETLESLENAGRSSIAERARVVCDLICSLTEDETYRLYMRLTGHQPGRVGDSIVLH